MCLNLFSQGLLLGSGNNVYVIDDMGYSSKVFYWGWDGYQIRSLTQTANGDVYINQRNSNVYPLSNISQFDRDGKYLSNIDSGRALSAVASGEGNDVYYSRSDWSQTLKIGGEYTVWSNSWDVKGYPSIAKWYNKKLYVALEGNDVTYGSSVGVWDGVTRWGGSRIINGIKATGLAFNGSNLFISVRDQNKIVKHVIGGSGYVDFISGLSQPLGIEVFNGKLFVCESLANKVSVWDVNNGNFLYSFPCTNPRDIIRFETRGASFAQDWIESKPLLITANVTTSFYDQNLFKNCGFNAVKVGIVNNLSAGSGFLNLGLPLVFMSETLDNTNNYTSKVTGQIDNKNSTTHLCVSDEPQFSQNPDLAAGITRAIAWLKIHRPKCLLSVNVSDSSSDYLNKVLKAKPDVLFYDAYPFVDEGNTYWDKFSEWYSSQLMNYRSKAMEYKVPYMAWTAAHEGVKMSSGAYWIQQPSESEVRMNVFTNLAIGAKGIAWYQYNSRDDDTVRKAMVDLSATTAGPVYYHVKNVIPEIKNLGETLKQLESTSVYYIPNTGRNGVKAIPNWSAGLGTNRIKGVKINSPSSELRTDALLSFFKNKNSNEYFMVTNLNCGRTKTPDQTQLSITITFDAAVKSITKVSRLTGKNELVNLTNNTLSLILPGGTGDLFTW